MVHWLSPNLLFFIGSKIEFFGDFQVFNTSYKMVGKFVSTSVRPPFWYFNYIMDMLCRQYVFQKFYTTLFFKKLFTMGNFRVIMKGWER